MMRVRAMSAPWWSGIEFLISEKREEGIAFGTSILMQFDSNIQGKIIEPTFKLDMEQAQNLMDDLWQCGLRPSEGTGSAGALAATQKHLEDMRRLVFEKDHA